MFLENRVVTFGEKFNYENFFLEYVMNNRDYLE